MISQDELKKFGDLIRIAEEKIIESIKGGEVEQEPSITDRFVTEVKRVFDDYNNMGGFYLSNVKFRVRTLSDRGKDSAEKRYGADICGVIDYKDGGFKLSKGFLIQAKKEAKWISIARPWGYKKVTIEINDEFSRLKDQIEKMLSITPDSFVIVYGENGFIVVPCSSIKGLIQKGSLLGKPVDVFFKDAVNCFVGDTRLEAYDDDTLEKLRAKTDARNALLFQIEKN